MKTLDQVCAEYSQNALDGRDVERLAGFVPFERWPEIGVSLKEGADPSDVQPPEPWTAEAIIAQLREDVDFGFEKALNKRGLSASMMNEVVKMWLWVLDDPLQDHDDYAQYGLPLLKAVAVKYGFENPIGNDSGSEHKYSTYGGRY